MRVHGSRNKKLSNYPDFVPDEMLSENQAQSNHGQSLKKLNERGGMAVYEILANIKGKRIMYGIGEESQQDIDELNDLIKNFNH